MPPKINRASAEQAYYYSGNPTNYVSLRGITSAAISLIGIRITFKNNALICPSSPHRLTAARARAANIFVSWLCGTRHVELLFVCFAQKTRRVIGFRADGSSALCCWRVPFVYGEGLGKLTVRVFDCICRNEVSFFVRVGVLLRLS